MGGVDGRSAQRSNRACCPGAQPGSGPKRLRALRGQGNRFTRRASDRPRQHLLQPPSAGDAGPSRGLAASPAAAPWHLSLRFGQDALRNGLDPLAFLRYLATLGEVQSITHPARCHPRRWPLDGRRRPATWALKRACSAQSQRADIEQVFEFAMDDCALGHPDARRQARGRLPGPAGPALRGRTCTRPSQTCRRCGPALGLDLNAH